MTKTDGATVDQLLGQLLRTEPSEAGRRRLDAAVARVIATVPPRAVAPPRHSRRRLAVVGLLAAALVTGGAGGALGLYDGMGAGLEYGFSVQLARSSAIDASAVDDGFRVTIDRAYLDGERLMLAVRVEDERQRPEVTQLEAMGSVVTDDAGTWQGAGVATSRPLGPWVATNIQWRLAPAPVASGTHRLRVEIPHISWRDAALVEVAEQDETVSPWRKQAGSWSFEIEVPVDGGATVVRPDLAIDVDRTTFIVDSVVIGPSAVRVRLRNDDALLRWTPFARLTHEGRDYPVILQSHEEPGIVELQTDGGVDDPTGEWSLTITEVEREGGAGQERISGPWSGTFQVP